jgi:hypothetical protein
MATPLEGDVYCIDTSALVDLKRDYPLEVFVGVWQKLDELIREGRLFAPREVLREIEKRDDELHLWVKSRLEMFREPSPGVIAITTEIVDRYQDFVDHEADTPEADPFLIAHSAVEDRARQASLFNGRCVVISSELPTGGRGRSRIPDVCRDYDLTHIRLRELFTREGWKFS